MRRFRIVVIAGCPWHFSVFELTLSAVKLHHMSSFNRILVGLDFSDMDGTLIQYTSMLTQIFEVDTIYFMHVASSLELPDEIVEKYPDLLAPVDETIQKQMEQVVDEYFSNRGDITCQILVKEGNAADQILRWSGIKEIDLILMGRKKSLKGSGVLPGKLARVAHCSLLMVPESSPLQISRIMVPVDFSKRSAAALDVARGIRKVRESELILQNTYRVPVGYHASGKSFEEFVEIMKGHAQEDARKFLNRNSMPAEEVEMAFILDNDDEPADKIYRQAIELQADLIVIGSRGRTDIASVLLGSVADKICQFDTDIPLLIVKNKKENMGFLEALMRI